jgi:protein-L-isoaspartate(D-aspartate) O-methyltransferase
MISKLSEADKGRPGLKLTSVVFLIIIPLFVCAGLIKTDTAFAEEKESRVAEKQKTEPNRPTHQHPAFGQQKDERERMVKYQISLRGISDPNVLGAMLTVPRHSFVREQDVGRAYSDQPLPIGLGQTISQPYIVAYMTEALKLDPNGKVLEIGTGSGYQAAVCAETAKEVYTIEILEQLAGAAGERLQELGYQNVSVKAGDGYFGWADKGPFDAIIITAAAPMFPPPLIEQLNTGGRMILPLGSPYGPQTLVLFTKDESGRITSKALLPVRFVPMIGQVQKTEDR